MGDRGLSIEEGAVEPYTVGMISERHKIEQTLARLSDAEVATLVQALQSDLLRSAHIDNWGATAIPGFEYSEDGAPPESEPDIRALLKGLLPGPA